MSLDPMSAMETTCTPGGIGPYVRFRTLPLSALPSHPDLSSRQPASSSDNDVTEFAETLLDEARAFLDSYCPNHAVTKTENKHSPPATSTVTLSSVTVPANSLPEPLDYSPSRNNSHVSATSKSSVDSKGEPKIHDELWHMRTSTHPNLAEKGSASWDEFKDALIHDHARREEEYTSAVYDAHCVLTYAFPELQSEQSTSAARATATDTNAQSAVSKYTSLQMGIYEMAHELPVPLRNRCFPVLVVSGLLPRRDHDSTSSIAPTAPSTDPNSSAEPAPSSTSTSAPAPTSASTSPPPKDKEFLTVQLPVDLTDIPKSLYTTGRNKLDGDEVVKRKDVVLGRYVSVERCALVPDNEGAGQRIVWQMATASDAGGALPAAVQRMATPAAIAKDVGAVIEWADKKRNGKLAWL